MLAIYLMALGLGGVLIVAGIALGGKDTDADHDHDVDHDHDLGHDHDLDHDHDLGHGHDLDHEVELDHAHDLAHGHAEAGKDVVHASWSPLLSMRFWTFALAGFGLNGTLLSLLGVGELAGAIASVVVGGGIGYAVALAFRKLARNQVTGPVGLRGLEGAEARVLLPLSPESEGKVRVVVGGQDVDLPARTQDPGRIERGARAMVVEVKGGVAVVTPMRALPSPKES